MTDSPKNLESDPRETERAAATKALEAVMVELAETKRERDEAVQLLTLWVGAVPTMAAAASLRQETRNFLSTKETPSK
jgi:hypothetical protein